MAKSIIVASDDPKIREMGRLAADAEGLEVVLCGDGEEALESAKNFKQKSGAPLGLIVLEAFLPKMDGFEVASRLQEHPDTQKVPVLMFIGSAHNPHFQSGAIQQRKIPAKIRLRADNYLEKPFEQKEIQGAIHSMIKHAPAHNSPHPISGLLGHPHMEQEVLNRFTRGETFSLLWMDVNHFRAFNDHYGTDKGNDVIRATVAVVQEVLKSIKTEPAPFLAHVGGDDFVLLLPDSAVEDIRSKLREKFSEAARKFYSNEEIEQGFIREMGRDKKEQVFPLMNLSMVALKVSMEKFKHYGEIVSEANELLHQTKIGAQDVK